MQPIDLKTALAAIPSALRDPLIAEFEEGLAEYRSGDWEKVGIKAGKFCEIAYTICEGYLKGTYAAAPNKPRNMFDACRNLENIDPSKERPIRIQVPRILMGLYELRNNRAIGHVSGEIDPNHMDAEFYLRGMKWILGEFVRFFSKLPEEQSRAVVEAVTARTFQVVWHSGDVRRILEPARSASQKVLILCYGENKPLPVTQVANWIDYKNMSQFRKSVLKPLHKLAHVHFDEKADTVQILPPGQRHVENNGLLEQKR
jgi:hypothetical protein